TRLMPGPETRAAPSDTWRGTTVPATWLLLLTSRCGAGRPCRLAWRNAVHRGASRRRLAAHGRSRMARGVDRARLRAAGRPHARRDDGGWPAAAAAAAVAGVQGSLGRVRVPAGAALPRRHLRPARRVRRPPALGDAARRPAPGGGGGGPRARR